MTNIEKYDAAFMEVFSVSKEVLNDEFNNQSADNWDSIRQLSLVTELEESFDIMFDTEEILGLTSYSEGKEILSSKYDINFTD